ncbi:ROK family protein, partial [Enterococcus faecalis]|uniref:ROK family protein n=1 Tax=Enterococcus faecalis TaxID=1351 RepID=UPI003987F146
MGHTVLVEGGEPCTCGRKGCWEAYASATALIREAKRALRKHPESAMLSLCGGDQEAMNGEIPFVAAAQGDSAAAEVV